MSATLPEPVRRVVLLGASNLTRGLATALDVLRRHRDEPIDLMAAMGNGRSYGMYSRVLGRGLASILDCGLWSALAERPPLPTTALVTDIGNDIMYGSDVPIIARWVEECLRRLQNHGARTVLVRLPVNNLPKLGQTRFYLLRTLFFPRNRDDLASIAARSRRLDEAVRTLARRYDATYVPQIDAWYGLDPIHYRLSQWSAAWAALAGPLRGPNDDRAGASSPTMTRGARPLVSIWNSLRVQAIVPAERYLLGIAQRRAQPAATLADGTRISIF